MTDIISFTNINNNIALKDDTFIALEGIELYDKVEKLSLEHLDIESVLILELNQQLRWLCTYLYHIENNFLRQKTLNNFFLK